MVFRADDDFSYFDWLNRLSKFGHGVVPDHVSFCGIFFFFNSELDGLCPRPSIWLTMDISKIQSGHSVSLASSFGQTLPSVLKPENSHLSDGPLIIRSLQLLFFGIKNMFL